MERPAAMFGMSHVALNGCDVAACGTFCIDLLGMAEEWQPDPDILYLTPGLENLALYRMTGYQPVADGRWLDHHFGFFVSATDEVAAWYEFLKAHNVAIMAAPRTHRGGARNFYCSAPEGMVDQFIHHLPIVASQDRNRSQANA